MLRRPFDTSGRFSRRAFLQSAAAFGGAAITSEAFGQDAALQALIDQNQRGEIGQDFDSGSRTIQMPKASLPTLSHATVQHTDQAIREYEAIVARGGWPQIGDVERLRLGSRHPSVPALQIGRAHV